MVTGHIQDRKALQRDLDRMGRGWWDEVYHG